MYICVIQTSKQTKMEIIKRSQFTGKISARDINVTDEQLANWTNGMLIQDAMPNISAEDREFLITGATPEEWEELYGKEEEL
jgi:hypothetical protein